MENTFNEEKEKGGHTVTKLPFRSSLKRFYNQKYEKRDFKRHVFCDEVLIRSIISKYKIPKNVRILDIGCGTGWYSHFLALYGMKVCAADLSKVGIKTGKGRWKDGSISWVTADAYNLPFKESFDAIFCSALSLFNVRDLYVCTSIARKLFGHLKKDGLFIFMESSNLSGIKKNSSSNHTIQEVIDFFSNLKVGNILGICTTNVQLFPIFYQRALSPFFTKLTSLLVKIHRKSCRIICIIKKW